jgi:hypothetical protein
MYVIHCLVFGGLTGTRESFLKAANGEIRRFTTYEDAATEAARLNSRSNVGRAHFQYSVSEVQQ